MNRVFSPEPAAAERKPPQVLKSFLFEISATDPATLIGMGVVFATVAMLACWVPHGGRTDPPFDYDISGVPICGLCGGRQAMSGAVRPR